MADWKTLQVEVPATLTAPIEAVGKVSSAVAAAADAAGTITKLATTLVDSVVDPTRVVSDLIRTELEGLAQDIHRAGGYVTGDWGLARFPFEEIRGGYGAYESRMVGKLLDQNDPTRPAFSDSSSLTALFFFTQVVDPTEMEKVLWGLQSLAGLFRQSLTQGGWGPVRNIQVGPEPPDSEAPLGFRVRWESDPTLVPPGGFAVLVTTDPDPLRVELTFPDPSVPGPSTPQNPQWVLDPLGVPLRIDAVQAQLAESPHMVPDGGKLDATKPQLVLKTGAGRSVSAIPFQKSTRPLGQALFFLSSAMTAALAPTGHFSLVIRHQDLPLSWSSIQTDGVDQIKPGGVASQVYIRVVACPAGVADKQSDWTYNPDSAVSKAIAKQPPQAELPSGVVPAGFGSWSSPVTYRIPSVSGRNLQETLQAALLIYLMTRPDLPIRPEKAIGGALIPTGLESLHPLCTDLLGPNLIGWSGLTGQDPKAYRAQVWDRTVVVARDLVDRSALPARTIESLLSRSRLLTTIRVVDLVKQSGEGLAADLLTQAGLGEATILDLFRPHEDQTERAYREWIQQGLQGIPPQVPDPISLHPTCGVVPSAYSAGIPQGDAGRGVLIPGIVRVRAPHFPSGDLPPSAQIVMDYIEPEDAPIAIKTAIPGVAALYRRYLREDGSVKVPQREVQQFRDLLTQPVSTLSQVGWVPLLAVRSDLVFSYLKTNPTGIYDPKRSSGSGLLCLRSMLCQQADLISQTNLILSLLTPVASRPVAQGAWNTVRVAEITPGLDLALQTASDWLGSVSISAGGAQDAARQYGKAATQTAQQARALTDQLVTMTQNVLGNPIPLPNLSVLVCTGRGTGGIVQALLTATGKPPSPAGAYAAGACLVLAGIPGIFFDILGIGSGSGEVKPIPDFPVVI